MSGELTALVDAADEKGVAALLTALPEADRRKLAKEASAAVRRVHTGEWVDEKDGASITSRWRSPYTEEQRRCALLAALGTCSASELRALSKGYHLPPGALPLWRDLRPSFLPDAAEIVVDASMHNWDFARALVRAKLSARPRCDAYTLGLLGPSFRPWTREPETLEATVLRDPEMLEEEIWRLFEVEGGGETSLATHDKYRGDWAPTLVSLMKKGHLSRERLLDASLAALERDFAPFRAGWFSRFHELLEPTVAERQARVDVYARLLASSVPPTVSFALRALRAVDAATPVAAETLLPTMSRVLVGSQKGPARDALSLLSTMAEREPAARKEIGRVAALALSHQAADVQRAALDLLDVVESDMDPELRVTVSERTAGVAASLRKRAAKWSSGVQPPQAMVVAPSPREANATGRVPVVPLASLDEVIDACARVIEDDGDPLLVELALDGVSRVCGERPADFALRTGPLAKRARTLADREGRTIGKGVGEVVVAWTAGELPAPPESWRTGTLGAFFTARAHELAARVARRESRPLLSLPTHGPSWIDGQSLVRRVEALSAGAAPERFDAVLALLRLSPEGRDEALAKLGALRDYRRDERVETPTLQVVRRKYPLMERQELELSSVASNGPPAVDDPPAILRARPRESGAAGWEKNEVRWGATAWPSGIEVFFAAGAHALGGNLDWHTAYWSHAAYLEPLLDAGTAMGPMARLVLVYGLAGKEPGENALAVDAAIAALEDGRLSGASLGETMAVVYATGFIKGKRWARTLAVVAQASPRCAAAVRVAIQAALRGDPAKAPRDEGALVELLTELLADVDGTIDDAEAWAYLQASRHAKRVAPFATPGR